MPSIWGAGSQPVGSATHAFGRPPRSRRLDNSRPPASEIRPWEVVSTGPEEDFRIFRVRRQVSISPRTGHPHQLVVVDSPDWVNVVALTSDEQVVLIEQFRHGIAQVTLEIAGGIIERGESPVEAGIRELREETGFGGGTASVLGQVHPNPAYQTNTCYTILVRDARRVSELEQDVGEDITVRLVPLAEIPRLIGAGQITHALVVVAFHLLGLAPTE